MSKRIQSKWKAKQENERTKKIKNPKTVYDHTFNMVCTVEDLRFAMNHFFMKNRTYLGELHESLKSISEILGEDK